MVFPKKAPRPDDTTNEGLTALTDDDIIVIVETLDPHERPTVPYVEVAGLVLQ